MHYSKLFSLSLLTLIVSCGGGGGGAPEPEPTSPPPEPVASSEMTLVIDQGMAYEKSGARAEISVSRTGDMEAIEVFFSFDGNPILEEGSASSSDYQLMDENDVALNESINFAQGENSKQITVRPIADDIREVPETLVINIIEGTGYTLSDQVSGSILINDASNEYGNSRLFLGTFRPQDGVQTGASGLLSFLLQGDNSKGVLTYTYDNLGSQRIDQHVHLWPSGTVIHDIKDEDLEASGSLSQYEWDMEPGGIFTTKQQMLDALFNGEFYVNVHSADNPGGEIYAHLSFDAFAEPPIQEELTVADVDYDIVRFLNQATFGATPRDYEQLRNLIDQDGTNRMQVYELWIDQQISTPRTSMQDLDNHMYSVFSEYSQNSLKRESFWPIAVYANDQLRQRMTFALSEILVISTENSMIRNRPQGLGSYWDTLANEAFGSYKALLKDVTLHPMMGVYLSHLINKKADEEAGTFPDENYAREVMQLFTFGLVHRNKDGSVVLGDDNLPLPTYDNETIRNLARVFTGLGLSYAADSTGNSVYENTNFNRSYCGPTGSLHYCWTQPMKFFPNYHDFDEKFLFVDNGDQVVIPESADISVDQAMAELNTVIEALVEHNTTAPFIARRLIQRFVTSNPSNAYIEKVSEAFGQDGDLIQVIKAILLDPEARSPSVVSSNTFGKFKEPILQLTAVFRLFNASSKIALGEGDADMGLIETDYANADHFAPDATFIKIGAVGQNIGQEAQAAPSVFNFFSPDYSPSGKLASEGLVAPELTLITESQIYSMFNQYDQLLHNGFVNFRRNPFSSEEARVRINTSNLVELWDNTIGDTQEKAEALVDFVDFYLNSGKLKRTSNAGTRSELIEQVESASCVSEPICDRDKLLIYGAALAPEFQIQQ